MNDDWNCSVCMQVLYRPCTLACGHSYCATCLTPLPERKCPQCRAPFRDVPTPNIVLTNLLQKYKPDEYTERAAFESSSVSDWVAHRRKTLPGFQDVLWHHSMDETMVKRVLRELDRVEAWNDDCKNLTRAVEKSPVLGPRWMAFRECGCGKCNVYFPGQFIFINLAWETFRVTLINVGTIITEQRPQQPDSLDRFVAHRGVANTDRLRAIQAVAMPSSPAVQFSFGGSQPMFNVQPHRDITWAERPAEMGAGFPL